MSDADDIVITGLGVVSPCGNSRQALASRVATGESVLARLPGGVDGIGAMVDPLPLEVIPEDTRSRIGRLDRLCRLFLCAAYLAVEDAQLVIAADAAERVGLSFGTGLGCLLTNAAYNRKLVEQGPSGASPRLFAYTVSSAAAGEVSIALGIKGANLTSHMGFAAGLGAVGYAFDLIRSGKADVVIAGGADALGEALLQGLADMGLLRTRVAIPFRDALPGVCPSEAAAVVILERRSHAERRGATPRARIAGHAAGFEPTLTRHEREPTGLIATLGRALARSACESADLNVVITSAHGSVVDDTERAAIAAVFSRLPSPLLLTPKSAWGETFGAHGVLSLALAMDLLQPAAPVLDAVALELDDAGHVQACSRRALPAPGSRLPTPAAPTSLVLIHSLCYSGPTAAIVLAKEK